LNAARCRSGGQGVAARDRRRERGAALAGGHVRSGLDARRLGRQFLVLDRLAQPARVVAPAQVVQPGGLVDPGRQLREERQVLGAQVELVLGSAEVEALVWAQLPGGALATVATPLAAQRGDAHADGLPTGVS